MRLTSLAVIALAVFSFHARANICGTDFQSFNPTTSGLDFVTVHSSETLQPCVVNMGLFFNYAVNSLTYSKTLNANVVGGQKGKDQTFGADLSAGMGLTKRWDFGFSIPFVISQHVDQDYYVSSFDNGGATEVKANTKYRLLGDDSGGLAGILSFNYNLIRDNPFTGKNPGPGWNFELAADTTLAKKWAVGLNAGYRRRSQGKPLPGVPFVPMDDQYIYSAAASYLISAIDTKVIFELYGSQAAKKVTQDTDRSLSSLEALVGLKHDISQNIAAHFGYTKQVDSSLGGPEWRVYTGVNWTIGPICKEEAPKVVVAPPPPEPAPTPAPDEVYTLNIELIFAHDSDQIGTKHVAPLDDFIKGLISQGFTRIVIDGHTDSLGDPEYNLGLSLRRANRVRQYMIDNHKVDAKKVEATGYGLTKPIADNGNFQGRQKNRRVEFNVWRGKH